MELRQLRYFVVVAEELHFSRAAARLNMSQPPLSQQIKALEADIGATLFHRTKRSVALTAAGRDLYEQLGPWLATLEDMVGRARRIAAGEEGQLSVACSFSTTQALLPQIIRNFRDSYPKITLRLREMQIEQQLESLAKGLVDIGIMRLPVDESHLMTAPLYDEALMVALPLGHPLAARKQLSLIDLKEEVFLKASRNSAALFESIQSICRRAGFEATVTEVSSNLNTAVGLVGVGMGIALVPESMRWAKPSQIVYRPLRDSPRSTVGAVWRRGDAPPAVALFVDVANKTAAASQAKR